METGPDSLFVTLLLLLHSSHSESEKFEVIGPTDPIVAVAGDDIILPCYLKPNISAEDMTVDWLNLDFKDGRVFRYQNHRIIREDHIPSYIGRTALFEEELWRGNTSLKLTRVQGTDEGFYTCVIQSKPWNCNFTIQVLVEAVGSKPVVSIEGHRKGGMGLLCESEGWHPQPELLWLDSKGVNLSAGPPEIHRDLKGFYKVKQHVIVQETNTNRFTCRVQQSRINEKMETEVHLPSELFYRTPWRITSIVKCCLGAIAVIGLALAIYCICIKKGVIIDQLKLQQVDFKNKLVNLIVKLMNLKKELVNLKKDLDKVEKDLTSQLEDLTKKLDDLTEQLKDLTRKLVYLKKQLEGITVDQDDLTEQLIPLPEELEVLSVEMLDVTPDQGCSSPI
ncbi:butyrophilin subfamily 3 member A2 isoform X1 [Salmo salar]|uniref:Butyrophilin subfamily 3 member A2-like isoform X1 n=1 Tax=Salmo salar TaxID=8030 RepID=A0ABM3DG20_SALSA|nr:butyrophilin subfamily 3 member A2-like isoform X1 [Salmo salar]XP_045557753.1 butyrophilin subfamily 3 member A2-like isoform X1 [Salmo salar]XP_045557754.1 butyrophilin subfamily 3 member A2-like isoform X1 [Salmo salar]XP_045557755.1 butyrophilin subfamily 3 member A2-like isoform X1 [Salmo salar]XP_045557756.1 butyrophilin subfamily 3 member A2-like isoform X1 [Salmo salar]XP_045557757.1 butyrophilin subfamily 3 member A2-like isoform X1 [Salmo salar]XP_045557758.1 butyrophilin subfami